MSENPYDLYIQAQAGEPEQTTQERQATDEPRPGEWRNVWVWIGRARQEIFPASLELLGQARELADQLGARAAAVVFGHDLAEQVPDLLARFGADTVYTADAPAFAEFQIDTVREALVHLVQAKRPEIILFPATIQGRNLAAQVAARLGTGIVPNCEDLKIDTSDRLLIPTQYSYENRLVSDIVIRTTRPQIATVTSGAFRQPTPDEGRRARHIDVTDDVPVTQPRVKLLEATEPPERNLQQYDAVLAGGLGLGSKEAFTRLERLGSLMNASVVGTRAAVGCGWTTDDRLLSRERASVRPRLYVAFGVVGEYDHLKAVEGADLILAVTDDPNAPICEMADFVALGAPDQVLQDVLGRLDQAIKDRILLPKRGA